MKTIPLFLPTTIALFLVAVLIAGCGKPADRAASSDSADSLSVYVVNYPLFYFAQRIGGNEVSVHFPAPADVDPAEWHPDDDAVRRYQEADIVFLNGAGYASWIDHTPLSTKAKVNTARNIGDRLIHVEDAITHSHGTDGLHSHADTAFTTWLDPQLAIEHARVIEQTLADRLPQYADAFRSRFEALASDLQQLDARLEAIVRDNPSRPLLASHPVYQYLQARYDLDLESVHWEPDEMPPAEEWQALERMLQKHPAQWMLWEDQPLDEVVAKLKQMGVGCVVYNPCANTPETGDFLTVMKRNADSLEKALTSVP